MSRAPRDPDASVSRPPVPSGMENSSSSLLLNVLHPWNKSQAALLYIIENASSDNEEEDDVHHVRSTYSNLLALDQLASPLSVAAAILLVFLLAPTIIIGNSLVLVAIYRFKRLRTPSNYLVLSLAASDLGVGIYMPLGIYLELCGVAGDAAVVCLLNYAVPITLGCVSVLLMVAIAVDRFMSLARPLRYSNLITHTAMERYIAVFWVYAAFVGAAPLSHHSFYGTTNYQTSHCSFGRLVPRPIQLFMFCAVYGPSACILVACYVYIYVVARGHARAISEVRHSLQYANGSNQPRYGLALAITTGMFLALWLPFQVCMLLDVFADTHILSHWLMVYLALPVLSSSAFNPWIYGYRNAELRFAVQKVVDDVLTLLGFHYRSQPLSDAHVVAPSIAATAGDAGSCLHQVQTAGLPALSALPIHRRECYSWNPVNSNNDNDDDDDSLLVPIAKPESFGLLSCEDVRADRGRALCVCHSASLRSQVKALNVSGRSLKTMMVQHNNNNNNNNNNDSVCSAHRCAPKDRQDVNVIEWKFIREYKCKKLAAIGRAESKCNRPGLRGSRSMIESFAALRNGSDVWIFKGKNLMMNGASIV